MFSRTPERRMRTVRGLLLVGWGIVALSLLYDPVTILATAHDNLASPFRVNLTAVMVQGRPEKSMPYAMGARIFWTMLVPLVPIFIMVFGHEAWRRVCPLSLVNQLPTMLGWRRRLGAHNSATGRLERVLALLPAESWMRRNHYYVQFGFLSAGLVGRILFYNSDRLALLAAFIFILSFAFAIGIFYGGKTWCNYFCPAAVIQAIYTGPGGLLESKPHLSPAPVGQSMCRAPKGKTDQPACVGCAVNCPDVDLEASYWSRIEAAPKRFMYYGMFGLVFAFYAYYYVYAGDWNYYFSGVWTHESTQLSALLKPGFYVAGQTWSAPKLLAAPLYFTLCILTSFALFWAIERAYQRLAERGGQRLDQVRIRHHMFTLTGFLSFSLFYGFAGRPNILLMPAWLVGVIDLVIAGVAVTWLLRTLGRDGEIFRRESLARTMRQRLVRLGFRSEEVLDGRSIEQLSPTEVYVLAKALPVAAQDAPAPQLAGRALVEAVRSLVEAVRSNEARRGALAADKGLAAPPAPTAEFMQDFDSATPTPWRQGEVRLRCVGVTQETHDVKTFHFVAEPARLFIYQPGQFLTLRLPIAGKSVLRCYSISSSPSRPYQLQVTVKRQEGGLASNWLHDHLCEGCVLAAHGPAGELVCTGQENRPYLFISGGSGVTPMMAMARWLHDMAPQADICFLHFARSPRDLVFEHELRAMAARWTHFRCVFVCERVANNEAWAGPVGRISAALLRELAPDVVARQVYLCGPTPFMLATERALAALGYDMAKLLQESFGQAPLAARAAPTDGRPVRVTFQASGVTATHPGGGFLLDAALAAGIEVAYSCRAGQCGLCRTTLLAGSVRHDCASALSAAELEASTILLCQARPWGDVVLEC